MDSTEQDVLAAYQRRRWVGAGLLVGGGATLLGLVTALWAGPQTAGARIGQMVESRLDPAPPPTADEPWRAVYVGTGPVPSPLPELKAPTVEVYKSRRVLVVLDGGVPVRAYRIGLGFAPTGDKERSGDGRTPEGEFYVCTRNDKSQFHLSLGLSYPNLEDAQRGLAAGLISQAEHDAIGAAVRKKAQPPWETALGGAIMIHGEGGGYDWTLGCVALENPHIEELFQRIKVGTKVTIKP